MVEYRPIEPSDVAAFDRIREYAFNPEEGPRTEPSDRTELGERYGLYDDGGLVSVCLQYHFDARVRGEWRPIGGLGAVATPPERRKEGYAGQLLAASVRSFGEQDVPLVTLWPFETAFYRQFGWSSATTVAQYACPPDALAGLGPDDGTFRPVEPSEWESLRPVHLAAGEGETLSRRRSEDWWRQRVFSDWGRKPHHVYRYDRDETAVGYLAYSVEDGTLSVAEMGAVDPVAERALLGFLGRHASQVDRVSFERVADPVGLDVFDVVAEPEAVECTIEPGPMVRLTDVTGALETLPFPDGVQERTTIGVTDPLVPANDGTYRLTVENGRGRVSEDSNANPAVTLDVGTLSAMIVGARDASSAQRRGAIDASAAIVGTLDRLFPGERVFLREFF
jgi:predicted acetyltransferase